MSKVELYKGDCLDVMWQIPSGSVDAIIADLPYGTTACSWDVVIPFDPLWAHYKRIIKPRGAVVLFGSQPFTSLLVCSNLEWFKYEWVWDKNRGNGHLVAKCRPLQRTESLLVFSATSHIYNPQMEEREIPRRFIKSPSQTPVMSFQKYKEDYTRDDYSHRYPVNLLYYPWSCRDGLHPTQKPVALLEYLIKTYTNEGDTVMDNVMGSGTAGVSCVRLNRNFIGIEKDADYFEVARKRIESEQENVESTLFYQAEKQQEPKPVQPTLFASEAI